MPRPNLKCHGRHFPAPPVDGGGASNATGSLPFASKLFAPEVTRAAKLGLNGAETTEKLYLFFPNEHFLAINLNAFDGFICESLFMFSREIETSPKTANCITCK
jgi:hypothetical protein